MTLWGGRFDSLPDEILWRYTVDTSDRRLLLDDIDGSLAHAAMLGSANIIPAAEAAVLGDGLARLREEAANGRFEWQCSDEDVHTAVERRLTELVGSVAGKLHTGRSRNDQVALDTRLYLRRNATERRNDIIRFVDGLLDKVEGVGEIVVPSYTHLQQAQAVPLAHHLLAHAWMLVRDLDRFAAVEVRLSESPLGAGAAGGSSLPLNPATTAAELNMQSVFANSMDAVASRDLLSEYVFCCAQTMVHLSRLATEAILWATAEFGWATFSDALTSGSSALPHKQNPDIAELVRGRAAAVIGDATAVLTLQKGLPLAYNRDFQEDKRIVFHADDTLAASLEALGAMIGAADFHPPPPSGWIGALDLAEVLASRGVPFREAHHVVGRVVMTLIADGRTLAEADIDDLVVIDERFIADDLDVLDPITSVARRLSPGGGSHVSVQGQLERLREAIS